MHKNLDSLNLKIFSIIHKMSFITKEFFIDALSSQKVQYHKQGLLSNTIKTFTFCSKQEWHLLIIISSRTIHNTLYLMNILIFNLTRMNEAQQKKKMGKKKKMKERISLEQNTTPCI